MCDRLLMAGGAAVGAWEQTSAMAALRPRPACGADKREVVFRKTIAFDRLGAVGSYIIFRSDIRLLFVPPTAEQGARANAHSYHAACYGNEVRNEAMDL
jgi:hypothetical protein